MQHSYIQLKSCDYPRKHFIKSMDKKKKRNNEMEAENAQQACLNIMLVSDNMYSFIGL